MNMIRCLSLVSVVLVAGCSSMGPETRTASSPDRSVDAFAARVYEAWRDGGTMPQLSMAMPEATLDTGYAVQEIFVARQLAEDKIGGYKAAVVGAAGQDALGVDGPITGVVRASGVLQAQDGVTIDLNDMPPRAVETEIGYLFEKAITEPLPGVDALRKHVKGVAPVIEVPGGASEEQPPVTAADLAARNVNAEEIIVGQWRDPASVDVDAVAMMLRHNGEVINTALGGDAAGGQWATLLKTVNNLVERGYTIAPGHVITNGALGKILPAEPGRYEAEYAGLGVLAFDATE